MITFAQLREKTLTPAEKKKREEIAKAMERENPGMDMSKKMAIATATAKRVAEEAELDEAKKVMIRFKDQIKSKSGAEDDAKFWMKKTGGSSYEVYKATNGLWAYKIFEEAKLDELNKSTLSSYTQKAAGSLAGNAAAAGYAGGQGKKAHPDIQRFMKNRMTGIGRAAKKLAKEDIELDESKPDAVEVMRKKQQMANISTSDKDKLSKVRLMLDKEKKK